MIRSLVSLVGLVAVCLGVFPPAVSMAGAEARAVPAPSVMAALGDSITSGFNACGWFVTCPSRSWSTGGSERVNSHYLRILGIDTVIQGDNRNFSDPGATSADLAGQVQEAIAAEADYVTILIGANDACKRTEDEMTPVSVFRSRIDRALAVLRGERPDVRILIASVPDLKRLWRIGKDNPLARMFWKVGRICQSMLADAASNDEGDQKRRDRVRGRVRDYNDQLAAACAMLGPGCRYDGGAVFDYPFTLDHISKWDYFHPNARGQRALARVTYDAGFDWIPRT